MAGAESIDKLPRQNFVAKFLLIPSAFTLTIFVLSCDWISLAKNSWTYKTVEKGEAANLIVYKNKVFATIAEDGILVVDLSTKEKIGQIEPPAGSESVDDIAIADGFLFALDARIPSHISAFKLNDSAQPELVSPPQAMPVEPFSGISAAGGICIVSGGTKELTVWKYDSSGNLTGPVSKSDFGRGQPDVLLTQKSVAYVSSHYWGPYFGIDIARFDSSKNEVTKLASLELDRAGFTEGGAKPANFPIESALLDDTTLLVAFAEGVGVIDVSLPNAPKMISVLDVGGAAVNVDVFEQSAVVSVSGENSHLSIIEFEKREKTSIRHINLEPGTIPLGAALTGDYAVVAALKQGVLIFERNQ